MEGEGWVSLRPKTEDRRQKTEDGRQKTEENIYFENILTAIMKKIVPLATAILSIFLTSCTDNSKSVQGTLFIIGGGDRTDEMMSELVDLSGIRNEGYMYVLPMASSVPDSSIMWAREDFTAAGINSSWVCFRAGRNSSETSA